jgi:hypothetical protein
LINNGYKSFILIANDKEATDYIVTVDAKELARIINKVYKADPEIRALINTVVFNNCKVGRPPAETTKPTEAGRC